MQGQPNAIAWDLGGVDATFSGNEWITLNGSLIWDLQNRNEYAGGGVYIPTERGIYLCDPCFKFRDLLNVTKIEIGLFKGEDLYFIVASRENIESGQSEASARGCVSVDLFEGDQITFRVKLSGTEPSAVLYAGSETEEEGDDLNDYTAWGLTFVHRLP